MKGEIEMSEEEVVKVLKDDLHLTKNEAYAVAELVDGAFFETIRNDVDIDSMTWVRNLIHGYEKLCRYSGYVGLTESGEEDDD